MSVKDKIKKESIFYIVIGIADGIVTALLFTTGSILHGNGSISLNMAFRISLGAALPSVFTFFVAEYTEQRKNLMHVAKELNLSSSLYLLNTKLGKEVFYRSIALTVLGVSSGFTGAMIPLSINSLIPAISWLPILVSIVILGFFGFALSLYIHGNTLLWIVSMIAIGILFAFLGNTLNII